MRAALSLDERLSVAVSRVCSAVERVRDSQRPVAVEARRIVSAADRLRASAMRFEQHDSSAPGELARGDSSPGLLSGRVLLVEDDPAVSRTVERCLTAAGYEVRTVASGREACALVESEQWEALVTDFDLGPGCDGIAVAQCARDVFPRLRIVIYTGKDIDDAELMRRVASADAALVTKPFVCGDLLTAIAGSDAGDTSRRM